MKMSWKVSDLDPGKAYRLHLCQAMNGLRYFKLVEVGSPEDSTPRDDLFFRSIAVPFDLLGRNVIAISELVPLVDGQPFYVDAHGTWLTGRELEQLDAEVDFEDINWATDKPPRFASR